jgi:hypothetical protein
VVLFVTQVCCYGGPIIYVDDDANGINDGTSWDDAYTYLQDALADANSEEKPVEIRVAQGIYLPDRSSTEPNGTGDRTATFQLINGVTIKGGYDGPRMSLSGADPNARDIDLYETILSGDLDGNDIDVNYPAFLLWEPTRAENSYHVVTGSGTEPNAILEGFTITGGNANVFNVNDSGGGMYNAYGSPTLLNCTFSSNSAGNDGLGGGGGIFNWGSSPTLSNCMFSSNSAGYDCGGGAMYNDYSNPMLTNCTFSGNTTEYCGGGMFNFWSNPTLTNCTFSDNLADYSGGGMHDDYGSFSPMLTNCTFKGNSTNNYGGGMFITGNSTLTNCTFSDNSAAEGGGIWNYGSPTLTNCILIGNSADIGGGIYNDHSRLEMTNCTLSGNSALNGNALACDSYRRQYPSNIEINNCILWDDGNEIWNKDGSAITIRYSNVQGRCPGEGNIDDDPCFADANSGDYHLKSQAGRWDPENKIWVQDAVTSPCIDAGDPKSPIGLEPFPNGGIINMGAYGGTREASKSYFGKPPCETIVAGDINGDCKVDYQDLFFLSLNWLADNRPQ